MAVQMVQKKESFSWGRFKMQAAPYVFISPFFISFIFLFAVPVLFSFFLSFLSWNGVAGKPMKFMGLKNYIFTLTDMNFWEACGRTMVLSAIGMTIQQVLALFFAFVLNSQFLRFREVFKTIFFLPFITSNVAVGLVFGLLYNNTGLFNYILGTDFFRALFNVQLPVLWLQGWNFVLISQPIFALWKWVGWVSILYLAGLQAIPKNLYEAAQVDGATWPQVFFNITIPLLMPMIQFSMTNSIIGGLQTFEESAVLLGRTGSGFGGADQAGVTMAIYLYNKAFSDGYYGLAAASSYILTLLIILTTLLVPIIFKERE